MKKCVDTRLISAAVRAAETWETSREQIGILCTPDWERRGLKEYMWNNYIMSDIPLTSQIWKLDTDNKITLFRALLEWDKNTSNEVVYY